jgi:hypothetical protein
MVPLFEVGNDLIQVSLRVHHPAIGETLAPFDFANQLAVLDGREVDRAAQFIAGGL